MPVRRNPYVGLRPYEEEERELFCERDLDAQLLRNKIFSSPLTLLYALSGVGKTSLLHTLVIPDLRDKGAQVVFFDNWAEDDPCTAIKSALMKCMENVPGAVIETVDTPLVEIVQRISEKLGKPVILILDQFEEFLGRRALDPLRQELAGLVLADVDAHVVLSLREESLAGLDTFRDYIVTVFHSRYRLEHLGKDQARKAIVEPAEKFGGGYEERLVDTLLEDLQVRAEPGGSPRAHQSTLAIDLPSLQIVCERLWQESDPQGQLTWELYQRLEGTQVILKNYVQQAMRPLSRPQRRETAKLLNLLAPKDGMMKKSYSVENLQEQTGLDKEHISARLEYLCNKKMVCGRVTEAGRRYELGHDAFINVLRPWVDEQLTRMELRRRMRRWIGVFALCLLVILALLGVWVWDHAQEEYRRTQGQIKWLQSQPEKTETVLDSVALYLWAKQDPAEEQRHKTETVLDSVAWLYRWAKQDSDSLHNLINILNSEEVKKVIPSYGMKERDAPTQTTLAMLSQDAPADRLITLVYNPEPGLNESQLRYQWQDSATEVIRTWGIPLPRRLNLETDLAIPAGTMRVRVSDPAPAPPRKQDPSKPVPGRSRGVHGERQAMDAGGTITEWSLDVPSKPDHVLVSEHELPLRLGTFFDKYKRDWTPMRQVKRGGPWWLVPRWTIPLWKVARHEAFPGEKAVSLTLVDSLLTEPERALTRDAVAYLLERERASFPQTVEEALAARGGIDGIRRVLIEMVRSDFPLTQLGYLLDALAEYPADLTPGDIAKRVRKEQTSPVERLPLRLHRPWNPKEPVRRDKQNVESYFELPPPERPVRVYLAPSLAPSLKDHGGNLTPGVLEALADVRGDVYKRFGVSAPNVDVQTDKTGCPNDTFRIEILKQTKNCQDATPSNVLKRLQEDLHLRYVAARAWWLKAEKVNQVLEDEVREDVRSELKNLYTLTDLKLILRAVIAPNVGEEALQEIAPEQTLRYLPWLITSLVFWVNVGDPLDGNSIATHLRETQRARLFPSENRLPTGEAAKRVVRGIEALDRGNIGAATQLFKTAVDLDRQSASRAFLTRYPQSMLPNQLAQRLIMRCPLLPDPSDASTLDTTPTMETRYELEEILSHPGLPSIPEHRWILHLCLLQHYIAEGNRGKTSALVEQLLAQHDPEQWTADEEYVFAYRILAAHKRGLMPSTPFEKVKDLLSRAVQRWTDTEAEMALPGLQKLCSELLRPPWYWGMLNSLADSHPKSYWIPLSVGVARTYWSERREDAEQALAMFERAELHLSEVPARDSDRGRAWLNWGRAQAHLALARQGEQREKSLHTAQKLLEALVKRVPPRDETWPALDEVYRRLSNTYILANKTGQAISMVEEGLRHIRDSELLRIEKIFLHLVQWEIDAAIKLAQENPAALKDKDNPRMFYEALGKLLAEKEDPEYAARRFLFHTDHEYRDNILMLLYWSLSRQRREEEAETLLLDRYKGIDRSTWSNRLEEGDPHAWREMLIGYYAKQVDPDEIFGPLKEPERFNRSPLRHIPLPYSELRCEAYFYDALFQEVTGDAATRQDRQIDQLEKAIASQDVLCIEYHMARYLLSQLRKQKN